MPSDYGKDSVQEILEALRADAADQSMDSLFAHARQIANEKTARCGERPESSALGLIGAIRDLIDRIPPENLR